MTGMLQQHIYVQVHGHVPSCRCRMRSRNWVCQAPSAEATATVRLSLKLPYHCNFGQQIMVVGSEDRLGKWDVHQGVPMNWSDGDVWQADLELPANHSGTHLEYKYVVRESDGTVVAWKPGDNCYVRIPLSEEEEVVPERVSISDAWDGSSRDVQAEGVLEFMRPGSGLSEELAPSTHMPQALNFEEGQPLSEVQVVAQAAEQAMAELDRAITNTMRLLDNTDDATSAAVLEADRAVAAAARRAVATTKALQAADPSYGTKLFANRQGELLEVPLSSSESSSDKRAQGTS